MSKCANGWTIECEHGRRYSSNDKIPYFEVTATGNDPAVTAHGIGSNLLVDIIKIKGGCQHTPPAVSLDKEAAHYEEKNGTHYVKTWYTKDNIVHTTDVNSTYSFIQSVRDAFAYMARAEEKKQIQYLKVDGDVLPVHVYPGEVFELDINLPGLYSQTIRRGIDAKNDPALQGKPDVNKNKKQKPGCNFDSKSAKKTKNSAENEPIVNRKRQLKAMQRIQAAGFFTATEKEYKKFVLKPEINRNAPHLFDPFDLKKEGDEREKKRLNKNVSAVGKAYDKTMEGLLSLPVILKKNDQVVRLSDMESLLPLLSIARQFLRLLHSVQDRMPRVGPYWEFKLDLMKINLKLLWGFSECDNYEVAPFRAFGMDADVVDASIELGFGLKKGPLVAAVFFRFEGKVPWNICELTPLPEGMVEQENTGLDIILTPGIGAKISMGELLEAQAIAQCEFKINLMLNIGYKGKAEYDLLDIKVALGKIEFSVEIKLFDVGRYNFLQSKETEMVLYEGGLLKQVNHTQVNDTPDESISPAEFKKVLLAEGEAIRNGTKWDEDKYGFLVFKGEYMGEYDIRNPKVLAMEELVDDIVAELQNTFGTSYEECFDFHPKTAEQFMQDLANCLFHSSKHITRIKAPWFDSRTCITHPNFLDFLKNQIKIVALNYFDQAKLLQAHMRGVTYA